MNLSGKATAMMIAALIAAGPVRAQEAVDGWDVFVDAANDAVSASVEYASGASIVVQCQAGVLITGIGHTPLSDAASRSAVLTRGDAFSPTAQWALSAESGVAVSGTPAVARFLRMGGPVILKSVEGDPAPFSMAFVLPSSAAGVDQVLTACNAPLIRERDMMPTVAGLMLAIPEVEMPEAAMPRHGGTQTVHLSCLIRNSRLTQCLSDREEPRNPRAGAATVRSANGTQVRVSDPAMAEGRHIEVVITGARIRN